jgi:hypothetical protein
MDAVSVEDPPMELRSADHGPDPCGVITPLDPIRTRNLLCIYNLLSDWEHILLGISNGFDVGINSLLEHTLIF